MAFKILHVIDSAGIYGAEVMLLHLMNEQRKSGIEPVLCSLGARGISEKSLENEARARKIGVRKLEMRNGPNISGALRILKLAHEEGFDVIHSHGYKGNILLGFVPRAVRRIPLVATLHGWTSTKLFSRMRIYEWLDGWSLRFMDRVILVSDSMLFHSRLRRRKGIDFVVIRNGVPMDAPAAPVLAGDTVAAFCSSGFVIGCIGRLSAEKGHSLLIDALHAARREGLPMKLVIIGEGPEREALEQKIGKLGLESYALLPGYREDASRYMSFFDIFVLPSLTEGLPITLLEAMRAGIPVVGTEVGGIPEALDRGRAGMLVKPRDGNALFGAIVQLYGSPDLAKKLAGEGCRSVAAKYSSEAMARQYLDVYEEVRMGANGPGEKLARNLTVP